MVKLATTAVSLLFSFFATIPAAAQKRAATSSTVAIKPSLKFLEAIQVSAADANIVQTPSFSAPETVKTEQLPVSKQISDNTNIESASGLQLKYAILLDTEVEQIQNNTLFSIVDEWYGTRYVLGGSTKAGIDCSAFVQAVYAKLFQIPMPRTAREQYHAVKQLSRTELKQGDLVFFKTRGSSISHVGIYLQNNKFVHAASSGGVMVSDLFEDYWMRHFAGVGRYETFPETESLVINP